MAVAIPEKKSDEVVTTWGSKKTADNVGKAGKSSQAKYTSFNYRYYRIIT